MYLFPPRKILDNGAMPFRALKRTVSSRLLCSHLGVLDAHWQCPPQMNLDQIEAELEICELLLDAGLPNAQIVEVFDGGVVN